tara:strand:- start:2413 stop:4059 length:1647 start_codon:yes stop_codon:yes gene_type:complete
MFQLSKLIKSLEDEFIKNDITESITLRRSSIPSFDLQIDNLVKFQKHKNIKAIVNSFSKLIENEPLIKNFEVAKNGFINIEINLENYVFEIENIMNALKKTKKSKKIILDYGGPNIGKPLHVGHLRSLNIGRSLYQINKLAGNNVLNDIHLGDWGMPVAQIICYMEINNIDIEKIEIHDLESIYPKASKQYLEDNIFNLQAQELNKKLNENQKDVIKKWKKLRSISVESIKETLRILNHSFDLWMGESDVNNLIPLMLDDLKKDKKISIDKGAYVSNFESDPKVLITKSDGSYLYLTTDLATVLNRKDKNKIDKTLYIVDKRQKLHFEQLFNSIQYFQFDNGEYTHVEFGTVNDSNGNPFRTRDGDSKKLNELFEDTLSKIKSINEKLDEETSKLLANTVLTFSDLITNRKTDYKFDLDKFTRISGKTGIYVQYAHVRAKKLIQNSNINIDKVDLATSEMDDTDITLLRAFLKFEYTFSQALKNNEPHHLADYLYELSSVFNSMYQNVNILENKNTKLKLNKLKITKHFVNYSKLLMQSLGIQPIEKM